MGRSGYHPKTTARSLVYDAVSYANDPAFGEALQLLREQTPSLFVGNSCNRGAELMRAYRSSSALKKWESDTDGDGLPELCDDDGDPLIMLGPEIKEDVIVLGSGERVMVEPPPYFDPREGGHYYASCLSWHPWISTYISSHYKPSLSPTSQREEKSEPAASTSPCDENRNGDRDAQPRKGDADRMKGNAPNVTGSAATR